MNKSNQDWLGKSSGPKAYARGLVAVLAVLASLNAQAESCPEPGQLEYRIDSTPQGEVAVYTSTDGLWHGTNPGDTTDYRGKIGFHSVYIDSNAKFVACSYEGIGQFSAARLSLKWNSGRAIISEGGEWNNNNCRAQEAGQCRFN